MHEINDQQSTDRMEQGVSMSLPASLQAHSQLAMNALVERCPDSLAQWSNEHKQQLERVLGLSDFIAESLACDAQLVEQLPQLLTVPKRVDSYRHELQQRLSQCTNEVDFLHQLRLFRRQEMVIIAWRDFCNYGH